MNPPKMPIHIGDYRRDTGHLRAAQHGAYLLILFHYWSTGSLPDDDAQLAAIACMTRSEWKKAKPIIEKFFKPGWRHGRVEEDLASARESYEKRARAGEKGGKAKATTKQSISIATAGPELPLTTNLEPEREESSLRSDARQRAMRLPAEWAPNDEDFKFATSLGFRLFEIEMERDKFRDHWKAKSGRDAAKLDWSAAWRNWIRNARSFNGTGGKSKRPGGSELAFELADEARQREREAGLYRSDDPFGSY